jgi:secreted Zn-dependent insulinase-like peptidase
VHSLHLSLRSFQHRSQGWATQLTAGVSHDGMSDNSASALLCLVVTLTDTGIQNIEGVVSAAFNYIARLNEQGPQVF